MTRLILLCLTLLTCLTSQAAAPQLNTANLSRLDRQALHASLNGDVLALEGLLADSFVAVIQVPGEQGPQTLTLNRGEFLLYAWQARAMTEHYRVRTQPARYAIARDGRSAVGTQILDENLHWQGQPVQYTSRRTTTYRPGRSRILITRLDVEILDWR